MNCCEGGVFLHKSRTYISIAVVSVLLLGCATTSAPTPKNGNQQIRHQAAVTPDLAGGSEAENRTVDRRLSVTIPGILFHSGTGPGKHVALTFDDGPDVHTTAQVLDILKQNRVPATFFLIGNRASAHPEMVRRIVREGHAIGNHSWDHPKLIKLTPDQVRGEVNQAETVLQQIVGYRPSIFRPPYGLTNPAIVNEIGGMGYKIIDWSVDTRDWAGTPPAQMLAYIHQELRPGGIILQHSAGGKNDNRQNTIDALPQIIATLKRQGYTFLTVPQMLNIRPAM
ncbi:hypothetical protein skT53_29690 [Effusibacillus dendaii]|uniref:NodB homology domain-containing protein n=2 Tax=Effusibacillus dendaii TaxID=2743772 RepID=A0A7I8DD04_9BACL|nr:hypothetical protein skT53_29690 [Effusibacillus dendaii]